MLQEEEVVSWLCWARESNSGEMGWEEWHLEQWRPLGGLCKALGVPGANYPFPLPKY